MSESSHQIFIFQVLELNEREFPFLKFVYAVPNGGHRHPATAGRMKAEGVRKGVPDIVLPVPNTYYHGAYFELKKDAKCRATPEQKEFIEFVKSQGYYADVCYGADDVLDRIEAYCGGIKLRGRR
jgi:hypothetical protein